MKTYILHQRIGIDPHGQPLNTNFNKENNAIKSLDSLLGLCEGYLVDGHLSDPEILHLNKWIQNHPHIADEWPASVILQNLRKILQDGVIDEDERTELTGILRDACASSEDGKQLSTNLPLDSPAPEVDFSNKRFCLTGKFLTGARKQCESFVQLRNGFPQSNVTKNLDYLVIGTLASSDWKHTSYGRKIERAVQYKEGGDRIAIVSEQHWAAALG